MCDSVREETNRGGEVLGLIDVLCRNSCSCASFVLVCIIFVGHNALESVVGNKCFSIFVMSRSRHTYDESVSLLSLTRNLENFTTEG